MPTGADQVLVSADLSWAGVHDLPDDGEPGLTSDDEDSWGYRTQAVASYSGLFGGITVAPFISFAHDFKGTTPGPVSTFIEDRKTLTIGMRAFYINRVTAELRYTGYMHGGRENLLRDRDSLRLQLSYYF